MYENGNIAVQYNLYSVQIAPLSGQFVSTPSICPELIQSVCVKFHKNKVSIAPGKAFKQLFAREILTALFSS